MAAQTDPASTVIACIDGWRIRGGPRVSVMTSLSLSVVAVPMACPHSVSATASPERVANDPGHGAGDRRVA